jgi:DNA-binding MarR family transcriptional regulator
LIQVGADFESEFPGGSALATECFANVWQTGELLIGLHNSQTRDDYQLSATARQVLAVIEGAGRPLEPTEIAQRVLITTASITVLIDNLEKRNLVRRLPHPTDRRKRLIDITPEARRIVDEFLPSFHAREHAVVSNALTSTEQRRLLRMLAKLQAEALRAQGEAPIRNAQRIRQEREGSS